MLNQWVFIQVFKKYLLKMDHRQGIILENGSTKMDWLELHPQGSSTLRMYMIII